MDAPRDVAHRDRFVAAVESIYAAAPNPSLWPEALQAMADCFGDVGTLLVYGRDDGGFGAIESPALAPVMQEFRREWKGQDLRAIRSRERGYFLARDASTDRDVVSPEEMTSHPFYQLLAKYGLKYYAAAAVSPDPRINAAIAVQRAIDKSPYAEDELETVARLGRHTENALRLSIQLLDAQLIKVGLSEALSRIGIGVLVLDSLGRVTFSNPAAERLLGDGLYLRDGYLKVGNIAERATFEHAIAQTLQGDPQHLIAEPKPILIERSGSSRPLVVYVLPVMKEADPAHSFLTHARALVLALDSESSEPPDASLVRDLLGLTLGEARIASLIGSGVAPRETAERLGISEETTRTVLKRIFSKVGVSRQSELATLLTKLVLR